MELLQLSDSLERSRLEVWLSQSLLSLLDITSSRGFGQRWKSLKMGEGQAVGGVELPCWGCCLLSPEAEERQESGWAGEEEQGLSISLAQPVKFRLFA